MKRTFFLLAAAIGVMSSQQAVGQSSIGFRSVGASVAYVSPQDLDGTFGFGALADLGRITPQIALEPRIEYWSKSQEAFGAKASLSDIAVGARAKYFFEVANPKIRPFAGAGLGLHFLKAEASVTVPGFPTITADESTTKVGVDFGGGMETSLSPKVDFQAALWYGIVSNASQLSLRVGLSQKFGGSSHEVSGNSHKKSGSTRNRSR
jgi:opacity protein-like surface antigen